MREAVRSVSRRYTSPPHNPKILNGSSLTASANQSACDSRLHLQVPALSPDDISSDRQCSLGMESKMPRPMVFLYSITDIRTLQNCPFLSSFLYFWARKVVQLSKFRLYSCLAPAGRRGLMPITSSQDNNYTSTRLKRFF
ncbi:hypothetical protein AMECASPLE_013741 [Ameca splendens]|uniref:Uncharacterized protein n=1 Tax=Ameca splendens TaxID=208324 RepID=A0ABV0XEJ5_9TELE